MFKLDTITRNHNETIKLGVELANLILPPVVIGLNGDLAAGKTTFVKGFLKGLDYKYTVSSPTFTLINNYDAKFNVMHVDFYREPNIERWIEIGFKELILKNNIVLVEWANLLPELLPEDTVNLNFEHHNKNKRRIYIK